MDDWQSLIGVPQCMDCLDLLWELPDGVINLCFADYPFSFSENGWDAELDLTYLLIENTIPEFKRILTAEGVAFLMLGSDTVAYAKSIADECGFYLVNWLVWEFDLGYHPRSRFKSRSYHILFVAKGKTWIFNGDSIRIPHQTLDKRNRPDGAIPSDVWTDIPDIRKNSAEYRGHKGQKPEALLERIILATSNEGDLVLDPFAGSFTTARVAQRLNRRWICGDNCAEYVDRFKAELAQPQQMELQV